MGNPPPVMPDLIAGLAGRARHPRDNSVMPDTDPASMGQQCHAGHRSGIHGTTASCRTPIRHPRVKERLDSGSGAGLAVKPGMTEKRCPE